MLAVTGNPVIVTMAVTMTWPVVAVTVTVVTVTHDHDNDRDHDCDCDHARDRDRDRDRDRRRLSEWGSDRLVDPNPSFVAWYPAHAPTHPASARRMT